MVASPPPVAGFDPAAGVLKQGPCLRRMIRIPALFPARRPHGLADGVTL